MDLNQSLPRHRLSAKMASSFDNVLLSTFTDKQHFELVSNYPFRIRLSTKEGEVHVDFFNGKLKYSFKD